MSTSREPEPGAAGPMRRVGVVGVGGIGLAYAAWMAHAGHEVIVVSPRAAAAADMRVDAVTVAAAGVLDAQVAVRQAASLAGLVAACDILIIAVPLNGHRGVMDQLLPHLRDGQVVIVSSMASLSALYLYEAAKAQGRAIQVVSLGTTALTARRTGPLAVRIMTRRTRLGLSCLPTPATGDALALAKGLFGDVFFAEPHALASALVNINPGAHGPLALFNWTRIERGEHWPQYHYMTPAVARVIERLDAERLALAQAFGCTVRTIEAHFAQSFGTTAPTLAGIAEQLHAARGGPPGPTDVGTRFLAEDVPFGLVFLEVLGRVAGVATPATRTVIDMAALLTDQDYRAQNDLLEPLALTQGSREDLLARVCNKNDS